MSFVRFDVRCRSCRRAFAISEPAWDSADLDEQCPHCGKRWRFTFAWLTAGHGPDQVRRYAPMRVEPLD